MAGVVAKGTQYEGEMAQAGEWPPDAMSKGADEDPQRSTNDAPPRKANFQRRE